MYLLGGIGLYSLGRKICIGLEGEDLLDGRKEIFWLGGRELNG